MIGHEDNLIRHIQFELRIALEKELRWAGGVCQLHFVLGAMFFAGCYVWMFAGVVPGSMSGWMFLLRLGAAILLWAVGSTAYLFLIKPSFDRFLAGESHSRACQMVDNLQKQSEPNSLTPIVQIILGEFPSEAAVLLSCGPIHKQVA